MRESLQACEMGDHRDAQRVGVGNTDHPGDGRGMDGARTMSKQKQAKKKASKGGEITLSKKALQAMIDQAVAKAHRGTVTTTRTNTTGRKLKRPPSRTRMHWHDGVNWYLRRKMCQAESSGAPHAIIVRTQQKVEAGELTYVRTDDDVEVYEIARDSKLRRRGRVALNEMTPEQVAGVIVRSGCARDFRLYYDAVTELSYMLKNSDLPGPQAHMVLQSWMRYLQTRIMRRGGPSEFEIARNLEEIRKERTGSKLFLPPAQNIDRR